MYLQWNMNIDMDSSTYYQSKFSSQWPLGQRFFAAISPACLPSLLSARHLAKPSSGSISQLAGSGHLANISQKLVVGFSLLFTHLILCPSRPLLLIDDSASKNSEEKIKETCKKIRSSIQGHERAIRFPFLFLFLFYFYVQSVTEIFVLCIMDWEFNLFSFFTN